MSAADQQAAMIALLLEAGFVEDGQTRSKVVRIPTQEAPLYGRGGGRIATFGGRARFHLPGSDLYVTVGARTTTVYRKRGPGLEGVQGIAYCRTRNLDDVRMVLANLVREEGSPRNAP